MRSERHDQAMSALKIDHENEVASLANNFKIAAEADARRHQQELRQVKEEAMTHLETTIEAVKIEKDEECRSLVDDMRHQLEQDHSDRLSAVIHQNQVIGARNN